MRTAATGDILTLERHRSVRRIVACVSATYALRGTAAAAQGPRRIALLHPLYALAINADGTPPSGLTRAGIARTLICELQLYFGSSFMTAIVVSPDGTLPTAAVSGGTR